MVSMSPPLTENHTILSRYRPKQSSACPDAMSYPMSACTVSDHASAPTALACICLKACRACAKVICSLPEHGSLAEEPDNVSKLSGPH